MTPSSDTFSHGDAADYPTATDSEARFSSHFDDAASEGRAPRREYGNRDGNRDNNRGGRFGGDRDRARPRFDRNAPRKSLVEEITDLDQSLLELLAQRTRLVMKTRRPKREGVGSDEIANEKKIRLAFEKAASQYAGDQRLLRQLFSLLQELDIARPYEEEARDAFNLAPQPQPVDINIPAHACRRQSRQWIALAAASGARVQFDGAIIGDALVDLMKSLNQAGAKISWQGSCITCEAGSQLVFNDKAFFAGDDAFNCCLLLFLALPQTGMMKINGGPALKLADLSPLRHFMPALGARIAHIVPKSNGVPLRLESAGIIPENISVPDDLSEEAVSALLLAAPFWKSTSRIDLSACKFKEHVLANVLPIFEQCGAQMAVEENIVTITPVSLSMPEKPMLGMDALLSAYLLAFPAFANGTSRLQGVWNNHADNAEDTLLLLEEAGLAPQITADGISTSYSPARNLAGVQLANVSKNLRPLALALAVRGAVDSGRCDLAGLNECMQIHAEFHHIADAFTQRFGVEIDGDSIIKPEGQPAMPAPWTCPDGVWALAFALASYKRPFPAGLRVSNPTIVNDFMPGFWTFFNALPNPSQRRAPKPRREESTDAPVRRRVKAE